jgi:hypothetical protein
MIAGGIHFFKYQFEINESHLKHYIRTILQKMKLIIILFSEKGIIFFMFWKIITVKFLATTSPSTTIIWPSEPSKNVAAHLTCEHLANNSL